MRLGWVEPGQHPLRGIRRVTAEAMRRSWSEIPHITGMDEVDATALLAARDELRAARGEPMTPLALLALAACRALRRFPLVNASIDPEAGTFTVHDRINLGIAVATDDGLVVPVIHNADQRGLVGLAAEINRAAGAARSKRLTPADLRGGTFTITNYGAIGGRFATPLVRPGEVGILGFGAVRERAMAIDGRVEARPTLPVVFSADHRLIDGDLATVVPGAGPGLRPPTPDVAARGVTHGRRRGARDGGAAGHRRWTGRLRRGHPGGAAGPPGHPRRT